MGVFDVNFSGRVQPLYPKFMESDLVTDIDFPPFKSDLMATTSKNGLVKLWKIPEKGLTESTDKSQCTFKSKASAELIKFHQNVLTVASRQWVNMYDLHSQKLTYGKY